MAQIMILNGGFSEHNPAMIGDFFETCLSSDYRVSRSSDLNILRPDILSSIDVLILLWTFGEITDEQTHTLIDAVQGGMGLMAWHGAASAFLWNRPYKFLLGGQFVDHPGGDNVAYRVNFSGDVLTDGIADIDVVTEQYYLLVDPSVQIIAKTHIQCKDKPWIYGVEMPVAWKRDRGEGKVFYCSLGHRKNDIDSPAIRELICRAVIWLSRRIAI